MSKPQADFEALSFDALPGWREDDHLAAFGAFLISARRLIDLAVAGSGYLGIQASPELLRVARQAVEEGGAVATKIAARTFFETWFQPHRVCHNGPESLFTGYYEPVLEGARRPDGVFRWPLLRRPDDLVNIVAESERGQNAERLTHGRREGDQIVPYATRKDIESGALDEKNLAFLWLRDAVDLFFLHVQGSGVIALREGGETRVTYDGKNGHPYTSIGRYLIETGQFVDAEMSLENLKIWLRRLPQAGQDAMWQNKSYIFFRELGQEEPASALGVMEIPLTAGRSMAVDTGFHEIGTPIYVSVPGLATFDDGSGDKVSGLKRLMIAQDVGSAIRGPERADIYYGTGDEAGLRAGVTIHPGTFYVLKPKAIEAGS